MFAPILIETIGQRPISPWSHDSRTPRVLDVSIAADTPEPVDIEARRVSNITCDVKPRDDGTGYQVRIIFELLLNLILILLINLDFYIQFR